ncbi:hypothetical protein GGR58DRAFT_506222 [Xylaria digitata]|nr:hypothetical protein GGR58DRAFT_506222 [Xylaria digitata]
MSPGLAYRVDAESHVWAREQAFFTRPALKHRIGSLPRFPWLSTFLYRSPQGEEQKKRRKPFEIMTQEPRVCDFCVTNILESQKLQGFHHTNYDELSLSASQKCPFCLILNEDIEQDESPSSVSGFEKPIYRWTIRPGGKIRESQAYVFVTFRPILPGPDSSDATAIEGLKERIFYLVPEEGKDSHSSHWLQQL